MDSIKDRNDMDLTEAEDIKKRWQEYTEELYKKDLCDPDNHDGVITDLQPDARMGASPGFPRAVAPVGVFSRGTTRISGSLSCGTREQDRVCLQRLVQAAHQRPLALARLRGPRLCDVAGEIGRASCRERV